MKRLDGFPMLIHRCNRRALWLAVCAVIGLSGAAIAEEAPSLWGQYVTPWFTVQSLKATKVGVAQTPMEAIKAMDATLDDYRTGEALTEADMAHNRSLKREILDGSFNIRELCRISLDRHWGERSEAERKHVVDLMTALLEEKAVTSKEQTVQKSKSSKVYNVRYVNQRFLDPRQERAFVATTVYIPAPDLTVEIGYKLQRMQEVWQVYDVIVDGSSLIENYIYQFDSIITKHGYPELVQRMERKLSAFREVDSTT
jgi:phospholipid transport system substrate-binding protein